MTYLATLALKKPIDYAFKYFFGSKTSSNYYNSDFEDVFRAPRHSFSEFFVSFEKLPNFVDQIHNDLTFTHTRPIMKEAAKEFDLVLINDATDFFEDESIKYCTGRLPRALGSFDARLDEQAMYMARCYPGERRELDFTFPGMVLPIERQFEQKAAYREACYNSYKFYQPLEDYEALNFEDLYSSFYLYLYNTIMCIDFSYLFMAYRFLYFFVMLLPVWNWMYLMYLLYFPFVYTNKLKSKFLRSITIKKKWKWKWKWKWNI